MNWSEREFDSEKEDYLIIKILVIYQQKFLVLSNLMMPIYEIKPVKQSLFYMK